MHTPFRMCIACRQMKPKAELIKVVKNDDSIELDIVQKKFGRGAYICKNTECVNGAKRRRALSKHFKTEVSEEIYDSIQEALDND